MLIQASRAYAVFYSMPGLMEFDKNKRFDLVLNNIVKAQKYKKDPRLIRMRHAKYVDMAE